VTNEHPLKNFNQELADTYIGKYILVGISYTDNSEKEIRREQLHGVIESASRNGINILLRGTRNGTSWNMPPMLDVIRPAKPGHYKLHSTNEVIDDPDLLATWLVTEPQK
jgi:hypothetical protein